MDHPEWKAMSVTDTTGTAAVSRPLPLHDLRVVELGTMTAGPFAATLLGDFGAQVIKVEAPTGDTARYVEPLVDGTSLYWAQDARNKTCVTADLHVDADRAALLELLQDADVLIENFRPGTLERWELGPERLHQVNPGLVIVRVSGFGQTGARRALPAFDRVIQALSGYARTNGPPEGRPVVVGNFVSDYSTAVFAALGCLVAVLARRDGAPGQVVDVSSLETMIRLSEIDLALYGRTGQLRDRLGNGHLAAAPMNSYETADGHWVMIHVPTQRMFERLAAATESPRWLTDERFATGPVRVEHRDELDVVIAQWFRQRDLDEALLILSEHEVPAGKMSDARDIVDDQHLRERGAVIEVDSPVGSLVMPGVVPRLSHTPGSVRHGAQAGLGPQLQDWLADHASWQPRGGEL